MQYLLMEAVAIKANREEQEAHDEARKEAERERAKQEGKEKLKQMFG